VDVLATVQGDQSGVMVSQTIVQNVMVTAIGQRLTVQQDQNGEEGPMRSVTLIATPEEARAVELAAATGRPRLVLRNPGDNRKDVGEGVTMADIRANNSARRSKGGLTSVLAGMFARKPETVSAPFDDPFAAPTTQPTSSGTSAERLPSSPMTWTIKMIKGGSLTEIDVPLPEPKKSSKIKLPSNQQPSRQPSRQPSQPSSLGEPITGTDKLPVLNSK
jgi:Flp pilus assembly protein CpaB